MGLTISIQYDTPQELTFALPVSLSPTITSTGIGTPNIHSYNISPSLPNGLSFNTDTGVISGTPIENSSPQNYLITTDTNASTDPTFTLRLSVVSPTRPISDYTKRQTCIQYKTSIGVVDTNGCCFD